MIEKLRESRSWQLFIITTLILIVPLLADINGRLSIMRRMRLEEVRLGQELSEAQAEHEALEAQLEWVTQEAYLEQWARVNARMSLPGEVAIIPFSPQQVEQAASAVESNPSPEDTSPAISEQWLRLFFDETTSNQ
jgi:cell division protein FtsB